MLTPRDIFDKDSSKNLRVHATHTIQDTRYSNTCNVIATISFDFEAGVKYGSLFIENSPLAISAIIHYIGHPEDLLKVGDSMRATMGMSGTHESIDTSSLTFSGRIIVYTEYVLAGDEPTRLSELARAKGLTLIIRDGAYLARRIELESPKAFISHDSRDKDPFVRDLARTLQQMLCPVWYDEYSLVPGQSLRASIEDGLKKCTKCVLILSPNFISNKGWTQAEFDSVFTREILEHKNVIIPIWHGVSKEQVYEYSPRLLDRVAIMSDLGVEAVSRKVLRGINAGT